MADNLTNKNANFTTTDTNLLDGNEPATKHDVTEGGVLGAVGGAIVGGLAGGPLGAIIGAVAGGAASAGAVSVVDKHDHDYARTTAGGDAETIGSDTMDDDATVDDRLRDANYIPSTTTAAYGTTTALPQDDLTSTRTVDGEIVVPIIEEELQVGKRQVQSGGARIHTNVIETPIEETVNLREEHVTVDRNVVDRPVTEADAAFQEKTYEVTETAEIPVVAKAARVVEEVVIGKTATDRTETVHDSVRRTDVEVEELDGDQLRTAGR